MKRFQNAEIISYCSIHGSTISSVHIYHDRFIPTISRCNNFVAVFLATDSIIQEQNKFI